MPNPLADRIITILTQYPFPHHPLSRLMYTLTRATWRPWKNWQINWFVQRFNVDLSLTVKQRADDYESFNAFFTRPLKEGARPVVTESGAIACPVDGTVSQLGKINDAAIFQAKGHSYDLVSLLGGNPERAAPFRDGSFATLYLSPRDYHRIHMPETGTLTEMVYVPGKLFSVSPRTTRTVPRLFARNERVVAIFDTEKGPMAVILVGALFVSNIETVWAGVVAPQAQRTVQVWDYRPQIARGESVTLAKGAELGRFNMGSTVIVIFPKDHVDWSPDLRPDASVVMGQLLAHYR